MLEESIKMKSESGEVKKKSWSIGVAHFLTSVLETIYRVVQKNIRKRTETVFGVYFLYKQGDSLIREFFGTK